MNLLNKTVQHKIFGKGTIREVEDDIVSIEFSSATKKFVFPDSFKEHLILVEKRSRQYVEKMIDERYKDEQLLHEQGILEAEKKRMIARLPMNDNSQVAFGFIYNDETIVTEKWELTTGKYRSGYNIGKPRIPSRIYPNTACLLTCRDKSETEEQRYIWGVCMVRDDFMGSECTDGLVNAHEEYRIILNKDERKAFKYWQYFTPTTKSKSAKWGSVEFKYFSNLKMAYILHEIQKIKRDTAEQELCDEFFNYFCDLNKIDGNQLSHQDIPQ